ncbi:Putative zinc ribbon domain protein [Anatilimnocola aggregata]|uniref:Zinc ribbon domain protein n=1 Tax=Anatilimnocola aggregata TaxID=2528021 RepID=A0A517Y729_9BACT|nr:C4-type zinc ribbon domain-containing protein [Anatilimnocola aggregata]QDU26039.1 Putative zinc ribbon domain protein [Anatilimnocola aggregata]
MSTLTEALRILHRIHQQIADLQDRLQRGPKQVRAAEANVKKCEAELATSKDVYRAAKMSSDEKQLQLKQREAKLLDLQGKLNTANSNKEYQLLKDQIAADKQASSVLADEILESLERLDVLQANIKSAEEALSKNRDEEAKVRARVGSQQELLEGDLGRYSNELADAQNLIEGDFKDNYLRLSKSMGADALAPVEGETCGGCNQSLTPHLIDQLRLNKPVFCKSCGRLLYIPE